MSLKLKDEDSTKRMKDMQEELKDPSLGEFSDLEQDPYVIESKRTTPIDKPNGFTIEGFTIVENRDISTVER